jgi:squalene cyclase
MEEQLIQNSLVQLQKAIANGMRLVLHAQRRTGAFHMHCKTGPQLAANTHLVVSRLGYSKPGDSQKLYKQMIDKYQLPNGSFASNPGEDHGSLMATAAVWGALTATGVDADAPGLKAAKQWIDANKGLPAVGRLPFGEDPWAVGPLLAFAGLLSPADLCDRYLPLVQSLLPGFAELCEKKTNAGMLLTEEWIAGLVGTLVRNESRTAPIFPFVGWLERHEFRRVLAFSERFQNPNGSWNNLSGLTVLAMASLNTMGLPSDSPILAKAAAWLASMRIETEDTLDYVSNGSDVWNTALAVNTLLQVEEAGIDVDDRALTKAVQWLVGPADDTRLVKLDNPNEGALRSGGWAFEATNVHNPDTDDTALVMLALGRYLRGCADSSKAGTFEPVPGAEGALDAATTWLLGMQHSDGGWGAFIADQPSHPRELLFERPIMSTAGVDWSKPHDVVAFLSTQLAETDDVSTADLTGRVLRGLSAAGAGLNEPAVVRATDFLRSRQQPSGAWFGRWTVNYVGGTAYVLQGLAAIGCRLDAAAESTRADPNHEAILHAVTWLKSKQNTDGGWGETPESYREPKKAGDGPSMPGLTALALLSLLSLGCRDAHVERAVTYLLQTQTAEGGWPGNDWLQVFYPPNSLYEMPFANLTLPLQALGKYFAIESGAYARETTQVRAFIGKRIAHANDLSPVSPRNSDGTWSQSGLRAQRGTGDPSGDELIMNVLRQHDRAALNQWFKSLSASDSSIANGPIPEVNEWLEHTGKLPLWADAKKIELAQNFFVEHCWQIAFSLFCASLPAAYAAGHGAEVLVRTGGLTRNPRHRVMETAQFLFDVLPPGALSDAGRGMRAIQKVRLVHAAVRSLMLQEQTWDMAWGVPINQEDLAGTMLSFSEGVLSALEKMERSISTAQADAWIHYWRVIGHLMGVRSELLPKDRMDAGREAEAIAQDQWRPSEAGRLLTRELVSLMAELLPVRGGAIVATSAIRELAPPGCADHLDLPEHQLVDLLTRSGLAVSRRLSRFGMPRDKAGLLRWLSEYMMQRLVSLEREGKRAHFRIPGAVMHDWRRSA